MNLLIRNGRVIDPANGVDGTADVLILDGLVSRVGPRLQAPAGTREIDAAGRVREIYSLAFFDERQALIDIRALLKEGYSER